MSNAMTDYIPREAVKQIIAARCGECADARLEFIGFLPDCDQCLLYVAKKAIESIPAADVRPVVRGRDISYQRRGTDCDFLCSVCGAEAGSVMWGTLDGGDFKFCPNCGCALEES